MPENPCYHPVFKNDADDPHLAATVRTGQRVHFVDTPDQPGPGSSSRSSFGVGKTAIIPNSQTPRCQRLLFPPLPPTEDGRTRIQCRFEDGAVWLSQKAMAELFQIGVGTINHHLKAIYGEEELAAEATIRCYRIVQMEGLQLQDSRKPSPTQDI